jgi:RNA polymerase sigma factor (sigma-70 family)
MGAKFEVMVKRVGPVLHRITHRLNGHFTFFDEDDLYQEALVHLWLSFEKGVLDDKTDSYILQGCYFHLKNYLRTALDKARLVSLYKLLDEDEDSTLEEILSVNDRSAFDEIDEKLLNEALDSRGLDERERQVLSLSLEGLTVREIGQRLGISHVMVLKIRSGIKDKCSTLKPIMGG